MHRAWSSAWLTALLAIAGFANYNTTCCCGDSVIREVVAGCCGTHDHPDHGAMPAEGERPVHNCYKAGQSAWLSADPQDDGMLLGPAGSPALAASPSLLQAGLRPAEPVAGDRPEPLPADRLALIPRLLI